MRPDERHTFPEFTSTSTQAASNGENATRPPAARSGAEGANPEDELEEEEEEEGGRGKTAAGIVVVLVFCLRS